VHAAATVCNCVGRSLNFGSDCPQPPGSAPFFVLAANQSSGYACAETCSKAHTEITASQSVGGKFLKQCRVHEAAGVSEKQARDWHAKASCRQPTWAWACEAQSRTSPERFEKADSQAACPTIAEQVAPHSFNCQTLQYSIEAIAEPQACRHSDPFLSRSRPLSHSCFLPAWRPFHHASSPSLSLSLPLSLARCLFASMPACSCNPSRPNRVPSDAPPPFFFFSNPLPLGYPNIQCHLVAPALMMPVPRNGRGFAGSCVAPAFPRGHHGQITRIASLSLSLCHPFFLGSAISTHYPSPTGTQSRLSQTDLAEPPCCLATKQVLDRTTSDSRLPESN
jgi:hypothetical protein